MKRQTEHGGKLWCYSVSGWVLTRLSETAVLAILFLLLMTLVSLVFLTAALLYADIARYNSAAAALLMNVD